VGTVEFFNYSACQNSLQTQKHVKKIFYLLSSFFFIRKIKIY